MHRRKFIKSSIISSITLSGVSFFGELFHEQYKGVGFEIVRDIPTKLFDGKSCWAHPRLGLVVNKNGKITELVFVMAHLDLTGNDIFTAMYGFHSFDLGKTWSAPQKIESLSLVDQQFAGKIYQTGVGDFVPKLHTKSKTLLGTGHTLFYDKDWKAANPVAKRAAYAIFDVKTATWKQWEKLEIPESLGYKGTGAGCVQRFDLPDGSILLPVSFKKEKGNSGIVVMHCAFDGEKLDYISQGNEIMVDDETRGLAEPSITKFKGKYYLTIRHNERGYITTAADGLNFEPIQSWKFDDGSDLGSYNTQQHWVTHSDALFLVYTRRGANNDHVFRNRAPLFMAEVDVVKKCVIRNTEVILVPERGARLGNFGVSHINENETWVTESEWMQPKGVEKYGSDGSVYIAKIKWKKPNLYTG